MDATTLNVMPMEVTTSAPEATLPVEQQAGITTLNRVSTPPDRQNTTDSSSMATLATPPPEAYNALNYNFNHQLPTPAPFYSPDDILAHFTTVENNIPDTPHDRPGTELLQGLRGFDARGISTSQSTTNNYAHSRARLQPTNSRPTLRHSDANLRLTTSSPTSFSGSQLLLLQPDITTPHNPVHQLDGHCPTTPSTRSSTTVCQCWTSHQLLPRLRGPHDLHHRQAPPSYTPTTSTTTPNQLRFGPNHHYIQPIQQLHLELPHALVPTRPTQLLRPTTTTSRPPLQVHQHDSTQKCHLLRHHPTHGYESFHATQTTTPKLSHYNRPTTGVRLQPSPWRSRLPQHIHYQPLCRLGLPHRPSPELPRPPLD